MTSMHPFSAFVGSATKRAVATSMRLPSMYSLTLNLSAIYHASGSIGFGSSGLAFVVNAAVSSPASNVFSKTTTGSSVSISVDSIDTELMVIV